MRPRKTTKVRIDLNQTDVMLIRPGLDFAVRCQAAVLTKPEQFTNKKNGYNKAFANTLRELRRDLSAHGSETFYFDVVQLSALLSASRLTYRKRLWDKAQRTRRFEHTPVQALEKVKTKLEKVWKCAMRAAIKKSGQKAYDKRQKRWREFQGWLRVAIRATDQNKTPYETTQESTQSSTETSVTANLQRLPSECWHELTREVIAERTTVQASDSQVRYLLTRLRDRIRRSEWNLSWDDAVNDPAKAKDCVFEFLQHRPEFEGKIKLEYADLSTQQSTRGEKYRASMVIESNAPQSESHEQTKTEAAQPGLRAGSSRNETQASHGSAERQHSHTTSGTGHLSGDGANRDVAAERVPDPANPAPRLLVNDKKALRAAAEPICAWLRRYVERNDWNDFIGETKGLDPIRAMEALGPDRQLPEHVKRVPALFGFETLFEWYYRSVELLEPDQCYRRDALMHRFVICLATVYPNLDDMFDVLDKALHLAWISTHPPTWGLAQLIAVGGGYISE